MLEIYVDPVCPWCYRTAQWFINQVKKRNIEYRFRPFSLYQKSVLDGNPPEEDAPVWLKLSRILAGLVSENIDIEEAYFELATNWHDNNIKELPQKAEWQKYVDDKNLDEVLLSEIQSAIDITGSDLGVPIIINRSIEPNVGYFGPVVDIVFEGDDADKLFDAYYSLLNIQNMYEIKRMRNR